MIFRLFLGSNIDDRNADRRDVFLIYHPYTFQPGEKSCSLVAHEFQHAGTLLLLVQGRKEMPVPGLEIIRGNKSPEPISAKISPDNIELGGIGQVCFPNDCIPGEGQVPDRCKFVQVKVLVAGLLKGDPGFPEFFVLYLEFDLVDLQLMGQLHQMVGIPGNCLTGLGLFEFLLSFIAECVGDISGLRL